MECVVIVIGNERIIRFGVQVTHDANSAANRVLDKKELFTLSKTGPIPVQ